MSIQNSILDSVGHTPMVRLSRVAPGLEVELLAKVEFMNPGGSVKDRIGVRMLSEAEKAGRIKPGDTLIEPTSGNTGIGLAMAAAVRGYRMIITMPEKMSREKQVVLEALGAEIIRTPTEAAFDAPESHIGVAKHLERIIPNSHILDQYGNEDNPRAHEEGTGAEILAQCGGRIDALVATAGTGGTITGIARILKRELPNCQIIGVDPEGSILAGPDTIRAYKVEGIGYDFIPDVLNRELVDRWVKSNDRDSFRMARQLIRKEGLLCGGSSGAAVWAALEIAKDFPPGARIVTLLPDSVRNYMTKFVDPTWMRQNGFAELEREQQGNIADMIRTLGARSPITIEDSESLGQAIAVMKANGISQMPCTAGGRLSGIITEIDLLHFLVAGKHSDTPLAEVMERQVSTVETSTPSTELSRVFEQGEVAIVINAERKVEAVFTKMDLIDYLNARAKLDLPLNQS